jgi:hypothetical protein
VQTSGLKIMRETKGLSGKLSRAWGGIWVCDHAYSSDFISSQINPASKMPLFLPLTYRQPAIVHSSHSALNGKICYPVVLRRFRGNANLTLDQGTNQRRIITSTRIFKQSGSKTRCSGVDRLRLSSTPARPFSD